MAKDSAWTGPDADLETSLFDYKFVAKQRADKDYPDEWFVLYQISPNAYGTGHIREKDLDDLINGKDWMKEEDIERTLSFVGMTKDEWLKSDFIGKFGDLIGYWGVDEIMGTDYSPMNKKQAAEKIGVSGDTEESVMNKAKKLIEDIKGVGAEDRLKKDADLVTTVLQKKRVGNGAYMQTQAGTVIALGAQNDAPADQLPPEDSDNEEETPSDLHPLGTPVEQGGCGQSAAQRIIGNVASFYASEGMRELFGVSKDELKVAKKMKDKGYVYALKMPGDDRLMYFKSASDVGPFLRDDGGKPEWNGKIEDLLIGHV